MIKPASFLAMLLASTTAFAQVDCNKGLEPLDRDAETRMSPTDFVRDVTANEVAFAKAFGNFGYTLDLDFASLEGDTVDGEFHQISRVTYDAGGGARRLSTVADPVNTLKRIGLPNRDVDALHDAFMITPAILAERDVVYSGRQKIEDFNAAVFDILPRSQQSEARGFAGRAWVRVRDKAIVRICGRVAGGPFGPMRYLVQRIKVMDQYWFPMTISADETVRDGDNDVHVRIEAKYGEYAQR